MKSLCIYHKESYQKYYEIYSSHTFEIDESAILRIFKLSKSTGEPKLIACYRKWDYFKIDEDFEDLHQ